MRGESRSVTARGHPRIITRERLSDAGIAPYILREDLITPAMMQKMKEHQKGVARIFGIPFTQANWLLVMVADTVLPIKDGQKFFPHRSGMRRADWTQTQYDLGARALIVGSLATMDQIPEG